jgi:hypothetical protein
MTTATMMSNIDVPEICIGDSKAPKLAEISANTGIFAIMASFKPIAFLPFYDDPMLPADMEARDRISWAASYAGPVRGQMNFA